MNKLPKFVAPPVPENFINEWKNILKIVTSDNFENLPFSAFEKMINSCNNFEKLVLIILRAYSNDTIAVNTMVDMKQLNISSCEALLNSNDLNILLENILLKERCYQHLIMASTYISQDLFPTSIEGLKENLNLSDCYANLLAFYCYGFIEGVSIDQQCSKIMKKFKWYIFGNAELYKHNAKICLEKWLPKNEWPMVYPTLCKYSQYLDLQDN